ncbi:hypothetical protein BJQ97_00708 [Geobacillus sp. TFV-3]|nr:hypothetical protein BJQ97_00708 [Geobacillus sp. TFV-3]
MIPDFVMEYAMSGEMASLLEVLFQRFVFEKLIFPSILGDNWWICFINLVTFVYFLASCSKIFVN